MMSLKKHWYQESQKLRESLRCIALMKDGRRGVWLATAIATTFLLGSSAAVAASGTVRVAATPKYADILIDGKSHGNEKANGEGFREFQVAPGDHVIELFKSLGPWEVYDQAKVTVASGKVVTVSLIGKDRESPSFAAKIKAQFAGRQPKIDMVRIPSGNFVSYEDQESSNPRSASFTVAAFEMGKTEVTFDQWDACVANGGCSFSPIDEGWGRGNRPVLNVSWIDAREYVAWLSKTTGKRYRLPTDAEWEFAARAGTDTMFPTGSCITTSQANYTGETFLKNCVVGKHRLLTLPVGSFKANQFGLHDMQGNVAEWVEDCANSKWPPVPATNERASKGEDCLTSVTRGGSWADEMSFLASSKRRWFRTDARGRGFKVGFRVARSL